MNITVSADATAKTKAVYAELVDTLGIETITLALIESMDTTASTITNYGKSVSNRSGATNLKSKLDAIKIKYGL